MNMKKVVIILGSIILVIGVGLYVASQVAMRNLDKLVPKSAVEELSKLIEELEKENGEDLQKAAEQVIEEAEDKNKEAKGQGEAISEPTPSNEEEKESKGKNQENKSPNKIEEAKKQVPLKDQAKGMSIAGKLDVGYLTKLSSGGLTAEEKKQVKEHIRSRLSQEEINEMLRLYNQYSYLLK